MNEETPQTFLNEEIGPLPYCPGCGHEHLVKALDRALVAMRVDPRQVVLVTDIGCIGLTCRHFKLNAFHGLHGRSITYASGLKLARPELTVIALMGDGGCGIGGTHLLNVARRNIGITLIVADNFNYGMTGGQHSVTTPTGGKTSTTPWGNVEAPMDICATAIAAGAAWVHRTTAFDKELSGVLQRAIEQPGFAMVEVCELCTAYYMPKNELSKKGLFAQLDALGLELGQLADRPRPEYSEHYRETYAGRRTVLEHKPPIETTHQHHLDRQIGIIVAGSAGQKIKSTATQFAEGAIHAGLMATQKDDYPITVQTGHSIAEVILSPQRIDYTGIDEPDYVVLISEDGVRRLGPRLAELPPACVVFADATLELPDTRAEVRRLDLNRIGKQVGKPAVATAALAALITATGIYPLGAMEEAIRRIRNPKIVESNSKALAMGAALVE